MQQTLSKATSLCRVTISMVVLVSTVASACASNQFAYGQGYSQAGYGGTDLIPASVAGSGATLSPTVGSPSQHMNPYGGFRGQRFQGQQPFNPYANSPYANSGYGNSMSSMNNPGQYGAPGYGGSGYGNSGYGNQGNFGSPYGMHRHGHMSRHGYMGNPYGGGYNTTSYNGSYGGGYMGAPVTRYPGDASRYHMGGYIKNYEITDTPSGNAVPLVAEQKKFEDLPEQKNSGVKTKVPIKKAPN